MSRDCRLIAEAARYYMGAKPTAEGGWLYPRFLRGLARPGFKSGFAGNPDLCRSFEEEAARQGVSAEQLLEHAVLYLTADLDAGRIKRHATPTG